MAGKEEEYSEIYIYRIHTSIWPEKKSNYVWKV